MPGAILDTGKLTSFWKMSDYTEVNKLRNTYLKNSVRIIPNGIGNLYIFLSATCVYSVKEISI